MNLKNMKDRTKNENADAMTCLGWINHCQPGRLEARSSLNFIPLLLKEIGKLTLRRKNAWFVAKGGATFVL